MSKVVRDVGKKCTTNKKINKTKTQFFFFLIKPSDLNE